MSEQSEWKDGARAEQAILAALRDGPEDVGPEMARRVYKALAELLPIYEDVYDQCCELLEPHVQRCDKPGTLPASVVESLGVLLKDRPMHELSKPYRGRYEARQHLIGGAVRAAAVRTPFSQECLMACGVFSYSPAAAVACELAEQILDLQEQLAKHTAGGQDA